jgi:hypothetical protein
MFSRRYLRRSLVAALFLPIILLTLFVIYQNRYVIFSQNSLHHHNEYDSDISHNNIPDRNIRYQFHLKPLINNRSTSSILSTTGKQQIKNSTPPFLNVFNNDRLIQNLNNPIQKPSSSIYDRIVLPVIETKNLQRFVHLDLKGAAPKIIYYEKLFPYLKQLGANGLLIEYEDMFPFTDHLSIIRHGFAYSKTDIQKILALAEKNNLKVMPLLQVYGHLEYVLKLKEFMHLREDQRYPQVITPCLEESYKLLFGIYMYRISYSKNKFLLFLLEMIDQMLSLHPSIPYLHMGCDEVYYRLIHPQCVNLHFRDEADLFIR